MKNLHKSKQTGKFSHLTPMVLFAVDPCLCAGFSGGSDGKESTCSAGNRASIPVLAWRIPGMGEPGGLPSMGSSRVGHD